MTVTPYFDLTWHRANFPRVLITLAAAGAIACAVASRAQAGFFDDLFGAPQRPAYPYSTPRADLGARGEVSPANARPGTQQQTMIIPMGAGSAAPGKTFCVRLCDGRYYPIGAAAGNATPVQMCSAMCPAAKTRVFHGGEIASATDSSGTHYSRLDQAFAYRKSVVPGCTCNGKDAFGLVPVDIAADPTLRHGDLVATSSGVKPYSGTRSETRKAEPATATATIVGTSQDRLSVELSGGF
jgi:hypothetical protein